MRLGRIQRSIVGVVRRSAPRGAFLGAGAIASELRGYDLEQVERSIEALVRRGIIHRKGPLLYVLTGAD